MGNPHKPQTMSKKISNINTIEDFLSSTLKDYSQVYYGKDNCCRCGCGGEYISSSYANHSRSDVDDSLFLKRLNRAKKLIRSGILSVDIKSTYINIGYGENICLCFYKDDIK